MDPQTVEIQMVRDELEQFYHDLDARSSKLASTHSERLKCARGCSSCCVDGITVFEVEALRIQEKHPELLASGDPHDEGSCAFLDSEGACRIYKDRPYVCRTQGLPLRWIEETVEGIVELRDICPLNEMEEEPVTAIPEEDCWSIGEFESRLAAIQANSGTEPSRRISLRSLFESAIEEIGSDKTL